MKTSPPAAARRRATDDHEEEAPPRKTRRQRRGGDEESTPQRASTGLATGLGLASLAAGVLVLLTLWFPAFAKIVLPVCCLGLVLGLSGLAVALRKAAGHGFPIAGCEVSGIALALSVLWVIVIPDVRENLSRAAFGIASDEEDAQDGHGRVRVGDWVAYRQTIRLDNTTSVSVIKQTITAVQDRTVRVKTEMTVEGRPWNPMELDFPAKWLDDDFSNLELRRHAKGLFHKSEKMDTGEDSLDVGDSRVQCVWTRYKVTGQLGRIRYEQVIKLWTSDKVPVRHLVREEVDGEGDRTTHELIGFGFGPENDPAAAPSDKAKGGAEK
jgi:hypothetical protein